MGKFEEIKKKTEEANEKLPEKQKIYVSRTKLGFCKKNGCDNQRRHASAYCGECK